MPAWRDLTGCRFGKLTAVRYLGGSKWECVCECGTRTIVRTENLTHGQTKSCGCLRHTPPPNKTHGASRGDRLYVVWKSMRTRCNNKNHPSYKDYGGRGISVCDEWSDFNSFKNWALESGYQYKAQHGQCTLDRIDVDGNYDPSNCRWVDSHMQSKNKRFKKNNMSRWKPVELIDESGAVVGRFPSLRHASDATGYTCGSISSVCRGKKKSLGSMRFRYMSVDLSSSKRYGTAKQYRQMATDITGFGAIINQSIVYPNTNISPRIGDLVHFVSRDNYPLVDTGAVIGAGICGWVQDGDIKSPNVTVSVVMLDETTVTVPIEDIQRV